MIFSYSWRALNAGAVMAHSATLVTRYIKQLCVCCNSLARHGHITANMLAVSSGKTPPTVFWRGMARRGRRTVATDMLLKPERRDARQG